MRKRTKWIRRGAAAAAALLITVAGGPALALEGYSGGRLRIVSEPGEESPFVHYYIGGEEKTAADAVWSEEGHTGQAIVLSGAGDTLELEYNQLQMHTMTLEGWYRLGGAAEGAEESDFYRQRLFTLSHSDDLWLSVMPHARDEAKTDENGGILDGIYLAFYQGTGGEETRIEKWNPAEKGKESYGLPLGEWHHVALTMDGQSLKLYVDGRLWFEELLILGVEEMRNNVLTIGGGRWEDPTLNALVDDLSIYDFAMTAEQIAMLYAGVDPLSEGATLPASTAPSLPTEPAATTAAPVTEPAEEGDGTLFGLPQWTVILIAAMVVIFIALSILLSIVPPPPPPPPKKKKAKKSAKSKRPAKDAKDTETAENAESAGMAEEGGRAE